VRQLPVQDFDEPDAGVEAGAAELLVPDSPELFLDSAFDSVLVSALALMSAFPFSAVAVSPDEPVSAELLPEPPFDA
jgi:hypothetical protein